MYSSFTFKLFVVNCLLLTLFPLALSAQNQDLIWGIDVGGNFSLPKALAVENDRKVDEVYYADPKGRLGFSTSGYARLAIGDGYAVRTQLGYTLMRFESHTGIFDRANIHNLNLGFYPSFSLNRLQVAVGVELAWRRPQTLGPGEPLNGRSVQQGLHWQGKAEIGYHTPNGVDIYCSALVPRLRQVIFYSNTISNRDVQVVERLQVIQLGVRVPYGVLKFW